MEHDFTKGSLYHRPAMLVKRAVFNGIVTLNEENRKRGTCLFYFSKSNFKSRPCLVSSTFSRSLTAKDCDELLLDVSHSLMTAMCPSLGPHVVIPAKSIGLIFLSAVILAISGSLFHARMLTRFCYNSPDPARVNVSFQETMRSRIYFYAFDIHSEPMHLLQLLFI